MSWQGRAIVETDGAGGILVMFPDGTVEGAKTTASAARKAAAWFKQYLPQGAKTGTGVIEWRNGLRPNAPGGNNR